MREGSSFPHFLDNPFYFSGVAVVVVVVVVVVGVLVLASTYGSVVWSDASGLLFCEDDGTVGRDASSYLYIP